MKNLVIALIIGLIAATIDVIPMVIRKLNRTACISAFVQWVVLGLIIPFVDWPMQPWIKGLLIGVMAALPIMIIVYDKEMKSVIPIFIFSAILGTFVGFAGGYFIK